MAAAEATQGRQAVERSKAPAKRTRKAEAEKAGFDTVWTVWSLFEGVTGGVERWDDLGS